MILAFKLNMPVSRSWNGKWSGDDKQYVITKSWQGKTGVLAAERIAAARSYSYRFSDGWVARVDVSIVDSREAARLRARSAGFCGYNWMVDSICKHMEIIDSAEAMRRAGQQDAK